MNINTTDHVMFCDACGRQIDIAADCQFIGDYEVFCQSCADGGYQTPEIAEADARLIAAAPELLEACKRALKSSTYAGVTRLLQAAIAKAEEG